MREDARFVHPKDRQRLGLWQRGLESARRLLRPVAWQVVVKAALLLSFAVALTEPFPALETGRDLDVAGLTFGDFVAPLLFLIVNLTSRRYGAGLAFAATCVSWILLAALVAALVGWRDLAVVEDALGPLTAVGRLAAALAMGELLAIVIFEAWRGVPWWRAPLAASLAGAVIYTMIAAVLVPALRAPLSIDAATNLVLIQAIGVAAAMAGYTILRWRVRPLPGLGGR